jgi:predicted thioredoxin/glutaredoxin
MKKREPEFMQELHKIREKLTKEWKNKSVKEISSSLRRSVKEFKAKFAAAHR